MAESVFQRMRRTVSASVETAVDAMERASGSSLMRESLRQIEGAIDDLTADHDRAVARAARAESRGKDIAVDLSTLSDNARFALGKDREDLARAAFARQIDVEAEIAALKRVAADARKEAARLAEAQADLRAQHGQMTEELGAFEKAQRDAVRDGIAPSPQQRDVEKKVRHAKEAFDRVMKASGSLGASDSASSAHAKVMEIRELERADAVEARLQALKDKAVAPAKPTAAGKTASRGAKK